MRQRRLSRFLGPIRESLQALAAADDADFARARVPSRAAFDARQALEFIDAGSGGKKSSGK